ncbi:Transmembrane and TPR repeat-containing protein 1 [Holothuria leucospilota]|uniref:dolichyl-phosphate-mannose--protein mannosyltransferase n=1 Tax=Holothuria leucospilota TaxID=206669 RepID=A0A9Q1BS20_HOLLE|nr:Transmembrane and TPR repeat-containing protein 1 [Holothuria leucospilota]
MTKRSSVSGLSINNNSQNQKHRKEKLKDRTSPPSTKISSGKIWRTYSLNISGPRQRQQELYMLQYAIVGIVAVLIYMNSLFGNLVHDDLYAIVRNDDVVSLQTTVPSLFFNDFWGRPLTDERSHKSYRPLTVLTFRMNCLCHGLNPLGFHIVNVALHATVCLLFMHFSRLFLFSDEDLSFRAALLFAVHPVHTEAVAGVVGRADILACIFFLLSLLIYKRCIPDNAKQKSNSSWCYSSVAGSIILAICSMLCKEHGITVLAVIVAYDLYVSAHPYLYKRIFNTSRFSGAVNFKAVFWRLLLVTAAAIAIIAVRVLLQGGSLPTFLEEDNPASFSDSFQIRFLTFAFLISFNCWLLFCPLTLSYDWQVGSIPLVESVWDWRNLSTILVFLTLFCICIKLCVSQDKHQKAITMGILLLVIPFLPASNIFLKVGFVVAERILYIPSMGFCILVVVGASKLFQILPSKRFYPVLQIPAFFLILMFACRTVIRNMDWQSRETLFRSGLKTLPNNAKMHYNWANLQRDVNNSNAAIQHYRETLRLYPKHASAHNNLATLLPDDKTEEIEYHLKEALKIDKYHVNAHVNMAMLHNKRGDLEAAVRHLDIASTLDPGNSDAVVNLASLLTRLRQFDEAEVYHHRALEMQPTNTDVLNNYGVFLMKKGHDLEAYSYFEKVLTFEPNHVTAMGNLAFLENKQGKQAEAESLYLRAVSVTRSPVTLTSLGGFYFTTGQWIKAKDVYQELLTMSSSEVEAKLQYGQVLVKLDKDEEAEEVLESAVSSHPRHVELRRVLASVKTSLNKHEEAKMHLEESLKISRDMALSDDTKAKLHFEYANKLKDLKEYKDALKEYQNSVSLNPSFSIAHLNMGALYHLLGQYKEAKEKYNAALFLDPGNTILKENLRKLERLMMKAQDKN